MVHLLSQRRETFAHEGTEGSWQGAASLRPCRVHTERCLSCGARERGRGKKPSQVKKYWNGVNCSSKQKVLKVSLQITYSINYCQPDLHPLTTDYKGMLRFSKLEACIGLKFQQDFTGWFTPSLGRKTRQLAETCFIQIAVAISKPLCLTEIIYNFDIIHRLERIAVFYLLNKKKGYSFYKLVCFSFNGFCYISRLHCRTLAVTKNM